MSEVVIYVGPTLPRSIAESVLPATYLPPIKRGDLGLLPPSTHTVGIIDGVFHQSLALSPKEVIDALDRGIRLYGASSIGALRAAETHMYGMIGVGPIFEMYRDGKIDADDEVAVAYDPLTQRVLSDPLVNIRSALRAAVAQRIISDGEADDVINAMKGLYYPSRSFQLVRRMVPALASFLDAESYNQKRDDAILMLQTIARDRVNVSGRGPAPLRA